MKQTVKAYSHIIAIFFLVFTLEGFAQSSSDFKVEKIDRRVKEFQLDSIDLSSPLNYYLSRAQVCLTGKHKAWESISTSMFDFSDDVPDRKIDDNFRNYILDENIDCIITYRDSVASVITHTDSKDFVLVSNCWLEDGRWVNRGQGIADNLDDAKQRAFKQLPEDLYNLPRIAVINNLPVDVTPFASYLSGIKLSPEKFILDMLRKHKVVVNGEYHRRKVSWDMLKRLISLPDFPNKVGCVFMELPSWHQPTMDSFMSSKELRSDLIFQIFRDEQVNGWWDRGEYEFLCQLWKLNRALPAKKKIRVVLADYQIPYSRITSKDEARTLEDRNTHMANTVIRTIENSSDKRNNLFLVGCGHACKSNLPGYASAADGQDAAPTAGTQLANALGNDNVFTVFQHVMPGDNIGSNKSLIRGGIFDAAFEQNGNRPVGFKLADSPFGDEPFDGIYELKYKTASGRYKDNFDGYLFLGPLADEPKATPLTEIFTDEFVAEMQRRATVMGYEKYTGIWFGRPSTELTKEYIIKALLQE